MSIDEKNWNVKPIQFSKICWKNLAIFVIPLKAHPYIPALKGARVENYVKRWLKYFKQ